jgi:hypothetical protein
MTMNRRQFSEVTALAFGSTLSGLLPPGNRCHCRSLGARVVNGKLSGYVFYASADKPAWVLGRLENGKVNIISSGKLNGLSLTGVRPRLELAAVGDVVRAFVDTYPVASGKDRTFSEGGCVRGESYEVLAPASLRDIGGENVGLIKGMGVISYEQVADIWQAF